MYYELIVTSLVLIFVIVAITTKMIPSIAIGLLIPFVLTIFQVIPASSAFTPVASTTSLLIIGALALGDACFRVGITDWIGKHIIRYTRRFKSESLKLLIICLLGAGMSAFLSTAGVQVALMTMIIVMSQALRISKSRAMVALGYSTGLGGTWSIVGTTLMVMAKSAYEAEVPGQTLGMFDLTILTLPVGLVAIFMYCFLTSRYQPDRCGMNAAAAQAELAEDRPLDKRKCTIVGLTFLMFIVLLALDGKTPIPANMVTVLVLLILGITKVSSIDEMIKSIDWSLILFISGITVLSNAMQSSGLGDLVGKLMLSAAGATANPYAIIAVISVVCGILTQVISNAGAFGIVLPFLPVMANSLGVDLKPLIAAACMVCSCGFCMPLATPTFMMLGKEGNVTTGDWLKQGTPILIVCIILTIILVPNIWPL